MMNLQKGDWVLVNAPTSKVDYPYGWYSPPSVEWGMDNFIGKLCEVYAVVNYNSVTLRALPIYGPPKGCFYTFQAQHLERVEKSSEEA